MNKKNSRFKQQREAARQRKAAEYVKRNLKSSRKHREIWKTLRNGTRVYNSDAEHQRGLQLPLKAIRQRAQ